MDKAYETACTILRHVRCQEIHPLVCSHDTNTRPAAEDPQALEGLRRIVDFFTSPTR